MKTNEDKDPFLTNLLKQSTLEEPSADFTARIMNMIVPTEAAVIKSTYIAQYKYWLIAAFAVISAISAALFFPSFIGHQQTQGLLRFLSPYIHTISGTGALLKSQPIISMVVLAVGGLLIVDKLFSRFFRTNIQYTL
jgi:hypothetical protein